MREVDSRGFVVYHTLTDTYGAEVTVKESSSAEEAKVWIFATGGGIRGNDGAAHLSVDQAREIRDALAAFVQDNTSTEGA